MLTKRKRRFEDLCNVLETQMDRFASKRDASHTALLQRRRELQQWRQQFRSEARQVRTEAIEKMHRLVEESSELVSETTRMNNISGLSPQHLCSNG